MRNSHVYFLCFAIAWTLACAAPAPAPSVGEEPERLLWRRALVARAPRSTTTSIVEDFTLVDTATTTRRRRTSTQEVVVEEPTTTRRRATTTAEEPVETSTRAASTSATTDGVAETTETESTTSSQPSSTTVLNQNPKGHTSSSVASSEASSASSRSSVSSRASASSRSSASSAAATREAAGAGGIFDTSNRLFPVTIVVAIAIVLIACLIGIAIIKFTCHRKRFADPRDYNNSPQPDKRSSSRTNLLGSSPDSIHDEKSWQQDAGMHMARGGVIDHSRRSSGTSSDEDDVPLMSQLPFNHYRRTATVVAPPKAHVQGRHVHHSSAPLTPLPSTRSVSTRRVPVPAFLPAPSNARPIPNPGPPPAPPLPPKPASIPLPPSLPPTPSSSPAPRPHLPHQPTNGSSLRYALGDAPGSRQSTPRPPPLPLPPSLSIAGGRRMQRDSGRRLSVMNP